MKFKLLIFMIFLSLSGFAQGDINGVVKFIQNPAQAVDSTSVQPVFRRKSDGRLMRMTWGQLLSYVGGGGSGVTPGLQAVGAAGNTYTGQLNATAWGIIGGTTYHDGYIEFPSGNQLQFTDITGSVVTSVNGVAPVDGDVGLDLSGYATTTYVDDAKNEAISQATTNAQDYTDTRGLQEITNFNYFTFNPLVSQSFIQGIQFNVVGSVGTANIKSDNLTTDRIVQIPNSAGTLGLSVRANGVDHPFNTAGLADIGSTGGSGTVTSVTGVSGEITVENGTTTPVIGISPTYTAARDAVANGRVQNSLAASTTIAPSATAINAEFYKYAKTALIDINNYQIFGSVVGSSESIIKTYTITANTMSNGYMTLETVLENNLQNGTKVLRVYITNSPTISGVVPRAIITTTAVGKRHKIYRAGKITAGLLYLMNGGTNSSTDSTLNGANTQAEALDLTQTIYIHLTCTFGSTLDEMSAQYILVTNTKS